MNFKISPTVQAIFGLTVTSVGLAVATDHVAGFLIPFGIGIIILAIVKAVAELE